MVDINLIQQVLVVLIVTNGQFLVKLAPSSSFMSINLVSGHRRLSRLEDGTDSTHLNSLKSRNFTIFQELIAWKIVFLGFE